MAIFGLCFAIANERILVYSLAMLISRGSSWALGFWGLGFRAFGFRARLWGVGLRV